MYSSPLHVKDQHLQIYTYFIFKFNVQGTFSRQLGGNLRVEESATLPQPHMSLSQQGLFVFINSYKLTMHTLVPIFLFMELEIHLIDYNFVSFAVMGQALNKPGLYIPLA